MASGVSRVLVYGAQKYAVRVQVNPDALVSRGIGIDEVQRAVQRLFNLDEVPSPPDLADAIAIATAVVYRATRLDARETRR